ncbi:heme-binding protein [uncultured Hoeflea sp.]|uniref:GlcG/HbpS family heme-binding protein n=1 Tax=uncultured Hoeflea sp. TaxID=538666 RepID=UPI0030D7AAB5|tara:strand:- start:232 stop:663 length:432 start_codon:yes stop_codon:yes gene_type:complete
MTDLPLAKALEIITAALAKGAELGLKPLAVVVLDAGGHVKAFQRQDGASMMRFEIASGKAYGALAVGVGSRWLNAQAETRPHFLEGLSAVSGGKIVAVPGGVLIKDSNGGIIGAVGITGDTSDNDELAAITGIEAAGFTADAG